MEGVSAPSLLFKYMTQSISLQGINKGVNNNWFSKTFETLNITQNYNFPSDLDGITVIKYLDSLFIPTGVTVTTENRCKGLVLFIKGDCIINGTLSMTARGARATGDNLAIDYSIARLLVNPTDLLNYTYTIGSYGGAGGVGFQSYKGSAVPGNTGGTASNFACGGGGTGAYHGSGTSAAGYVYAGAAGTSYSGGSGSGGVSPRNKSIGGYAPEGNGGSGAAGYVARSDATSVGAGGGAGNPGGTSVTLGGGDITNGENGTGGLIILVVKGNLIIGSSGIISSNGTNGGHAGSATLHAGGGGSGGGSITLLYSGTHTNAGSIQANGGIGGYWGGGNGGAGSIRVGKITI